MQSLSRSHSAQRSGLSACVCAPRPRSWRPLGVTPTLRCAANGAATTTTAYASPVEQNRWTPCPLGQQLCSWVQENGGHVDARLVITADTPSGSRGVVATSAISAEEAEASPPIRVPEVLYMTATDATRILQQRIDEARAAAPERHPPQPQPAGGLLARLLAAAAPPAAAPPISEVEPVARLGLLLAHERSKGRRSAWWPYIESLPAGPPCAWLMPDGDLRRELDAAASAHGLPPGALSGWEAPVRRAGAAARARAAALAAAYSGALGVAEGDIVWGMAHAVSRAFGDDEDAAMAPLVDSCNHQDGAGKPYPVFVPAPEGAAAESGFASGEDSDDEVGEVMVCIAPQQNGRFVALGAGGELCISYGEISAQSRRAGRTDWLGVFVTFGFVPRDADLSSELGAP